jgi:Flp pilus assembly protein TadD
VSATGPFALLSQFVGGAREMRAYAAGAALQTDDRMALEFTGPRAMYRGTALDNTTAIRSLLDSADVPAAVSRVVATAADWRDRATMMMRAGAYDEAVKNYREALDRVPSDSAAADGLVAAAIAARQPGEAIRLFDAIAAKRPRDPRIRIAYSKLLAATGDFEAAAVRATEACHLAPDDATAWAQLASVFSDAGAADRLEPIVATMRRIDPAAERTSYYTAAVAFMRGDLSRAKAAVEAAIAVDSSRADAHNLLGAIEASSGRIDTARAEFHRALELNARDSSTYVNLAVLEMNRGDPEAATDWFAEALSLDPGSRAAREGLARARAATGRR